MIEYRSRDSPGIDSRDQRLSTARATALLDKSTIWPQALQLKVGAMVMLISVSVLITTSFVYSLTMSEHGSECDRRHHPF
jgi:hypothetical protein